MRIPIRYEEVPYRILSLRALCDLGVSAVSNGIKYIHRSDAENAEVAQRVFILRVSPSGGSSAA